MRLIGAVCLLLCCALAGCSAAAQIRSEAELIRDIRAMLNAACNQLRSSLPPVAELLQTLAGQARFRHLGFLHTAAAHAESFPQSWEDAAAADSALSSALRQQVTEIGRILGTLPLAEQLSALSLCDEQLKNLQSAAEERARQSGSLFQRLGVLIGLFLAVLAL